MTCNTSAVAVCCSSASSRSAVRSASNGATRHFRVRVRRPCRQRVCSSYAGPPCSPAQTLPARDRLTKQPPAATSPDRKTVGLKTLKNRLSDMSGSPPPERGSWSRPRTARRRDRAAASRAGVGDRARHPRRLGQARHARSGLAAETAAHRRLYSRTAARGPGRGSERPVVLTPSARGRVCPGKPARIVATIDAVGNFAKFTG